MDINYYWTKIQEVFEDAYESSAHYAIATVSNDGLPHITPIGSLILRDDKTGFFFEEFPVNMPRNIEQNQRVCILAVNSGKSFWFKSLFRGKFKKPPAVRLMGTVKERREATEEEIALWHERIKEAQKLKGYEIMWKDMRYVREIYFDSFEPVYCGSMTNDLWNDQPEIE